MTRPRRIVIFIRFDFNIAKRVDEFGSQRGIGEGVHQSWDEALKDSFEGGKF